MKTILTRLTEKLCEVEAIREDIMELRFGFKLRYRNTDYSLGVNKRWYLSYTETATITWDLNYFDNKKGIENIGNPIQLHHLLWYCEEKGYAGAVGINGKFIGNRQVSGSYTEIQLDITKDLSNQSEETLEAILNFIK